jgi:hypothetical protein
MGAAEQIVPALAPDEVMKKKFYFYPEMGHSRGRRNGVLNLSTPKRDVLQYIRVEYVL